MASPSAADCKKNNSARDNADAAQIALDAKLDELNELVAAQTAQSAQIAELSQQLQLADARLEAIKTQLATEQKKSNMDAPRSLLEMEHALRPAKAIPVNGAESDKTRGSDESSHETYLERMRRERKEARDRIHKMHEQRASVANLQKRKVLGDESDKTRGSDESSYEPVSERFKRERKETRDRFRRLYGQRSSVTNLQRRRILEAGAYAEVILGQDE